MKFDQFPDFWRFFWPNFLNVISNKNIPHKDPPPPHTHKKLIFFETLHPIFRSLAAFCSGADGLSNLYFAFSFFVNPVTLQPEVCLSIHFASPSFVNRWETHLSSSLCHYFKVSKTKIVNPALLFLTCFRHCWITVCHSYFSSVHFLAVSKLCCRDELGSVFLFPQINFIQWCDQLNILTVLTMRLSCISNFCT